MALRREDGGVRTDGLAEERHPELRVEVDDTSLLPLAEQFLQDVVDYLKRERTRLEPGQSMPYGYWLVRWEEDGDGSLAAWEYDAPCERRVRGANLTLTYRRDQVATCERAGAPYAPPLGDQLAAVAAGVLNGEPVRGLRYRAPEHMSGWWFLTDRWQSGDEVQTEHLYHVTAARPEVARYLALPVGFCFEVRDGGEKVWFDEEVASQEE